MVIDSVFGAELEACRVILEMLEISQCNITLIGCLECEAELQI
jgi:hypothetical protein